jgi:predicted nucleic acid-binding protein
VRIALDSNILVYAEGVNGPDRRDAALAAIQDLDDQDILIPVQALGELFAVLTRKARLSAADARAAVLGWADAYDVIDTRTATLTEAMGLVATHHLSPWDAVIVAAAAGAECRVLLSEDMQAGFTWRGLSVRNPFEASDGSA